MRQLGHARLNDGLELQWRLAAKSVTRPHRWVRPMMGTVFTRGGVFGGSERMDSAKTLVVFAPNRLVQPFRPNNHFPHCDFQVRPHQYWRQRSTRHLFTPTQVVTTTSLQEEKFDGPSV